MAKLNREGSGSTCSRVRGNAKRPHEKEAIRFEFEKSKIQPKEPETMAMRAIVTMRMMRTPRNQR